MIRLVTVMLFFLIGSVRGNDSCKECQAKHLKEDKKNKGTCLKIGKAIQHQMLGVLNGIASMVDEAEQASTDNVKKAVKATIDKYVDDVIDLAGMVPKKVWAGLSNYVYSGVKNVKEGDVSDAADDAMDLFSNLMNMRTADDACAAVAAEVSKLTAQGEGAMEKAVKKWKDAAAQHKSRSRRQASLMEDKPGKGGKYKDAPFSGDVPVNLRDEYEQNW